MDPQKPKTVADMIAILNKMPQDAPILIRDSYHDCQYEIWKIYAPGEFGGDDDADAVILWDGE